MTKFEDCKKEWLEYAEDEKTLTAEIVEKIKKVLDEQKEIGFYFPFPRWETIDTIKRHHWFCFKTTSKTILKCPCCDSDKITISYVRVSCDYFEIYECSSCGYFSIMHKIRFPSSTYYLYSSSVSTLKNLNSQLDRYLVNRNV